MPPLEGSHPSSQSTSSGGGALGSSSPTPTHDTLGTGGAPAAPLLDGPGHVPLSPTNTTTSLPASSLPTTSWAAVPMGASASTSASSGISGMGAAELLQPLSAAPSFCRHSSDFSSGRMAGKFHQLSSKLGHTLKLRRRSSDRELDQPSSAGGTHGSGSGPAPQARGGLIGASGGGNSAGPGQLAPGIGHGNAGGGGGEGAGLLRHESDIEDFQPPLQPFRNPFSLVTTPLTKIMRLPRAMAASGSLAVPSEDSSGMNHASTNVHGLPFAAGSATVTGSPAVSTPTRARGGEAAHTWMKRFVPGGGGGGGGRSFGLGGGGAPFGAAHGAALPGGASASWPEFEGSPPMGYLWLWLGNLKRWQRRFFVASDTPGVLLIYKRMNLKGKVSSISLRNATLKEDEVNNRQLEIVTPAGSIFLRVMKPADRSKWMDCLRQSLEVYAAHKTVVEELKGKGIIPSDIPPADPAAFTSVLPAALSNPLLRTSGAIVPPEVVADLDAEQRRRIRSRVSDRLAEIWPFEQEMERHMAVMRQQLLAVVSGLNVRMPMLTPSSSTMRISALSAQASIPATAAATITAQQAAAASAAIAASPVEGSEQTAAPQQQTAPLDSDQQPSIPTSSSFLIAPQVHLPQPQQPPQPPGAADTHQAAANTLLAGGASSGSSFGRSLTDQQPHRLASARPRVVVKATSLQQAHGNLLNAVRAILYNEAVRIVQLEAENAALARSFNILKARLPDGPSGTAGSSAPRRGRGLATASTGTGAAPTAPATVVADEAGSANSPLLGSVPASAAHEEYDEAMDTSGSDGWSVRTADEDAFALEDATTSGGMRPSGDGTVGSVDREADDEKEEELEDELEEEEEGRQHQAVLTALEVVRQVDFVSKDKSLARFTSGIAPGAGSSAITASTGDAVSAGRTLPDNEDEEEVEDDEEGMQNDTDDTVNDGEGSLQWSRTRLPAPKPLGKGFSIWSILKNMIGRDLTKITMPATINEPLTVLQRLVEILEYRSLADRALECPSSAERMVWVALWAATFYNSQPFRLGKPFNPLLGETYEWRSPDGACRFLGEQVSHHPPVSCIYASGANGGWEAYGEVETRTKFWGKSIELIWHGSESITLNPFGEEYRYNKANVCVQDIILGNYWVEVYGEVKIVNQKTGDVCKLNFKPCRGLLNERGRVDGSVRNAQGQELYKISGSTSDKLYAELTRAGEAARLAAGLPPVTSGPASIGSGGYPSRRTTGSGGGSAGASSPPPVSIGTERTLLWQKMEYPEDAMEQYMFTRFAIDINNPAVPYASQLAPTDARFRPDQRAMELGDWARATSEKLRLEEKQRQARRDRKARGEDWQTRWFTYNGSPGAKDLTNTADQPGFSWNFNGEYWKHQQARDWACCASIY